MSVFDGGFMACSPWDYKVRTGPCPRQTTCIRNDLATPWRMMPRIGNAVIVSSSGATWRRRWALPEPDIHPELQRLVLAEQDSQRQIAGAGEP